MLYNLLCSTVSYFLAPFGFLMTQQVLNNCTAGYFKHDIASDMTNQMKGWISFKFSRFNICLMNFIFCPQNVAVFLIHSVNVGFLEEVVTLRYRMDFQPLKDRLKMFAEGSEKKMVSQNRRSKWALHLDEIDKSCFHFNLFI